MEVSELCMGGCEMVGLASSGAAFGPFVLMGGGSVINNTVTFSWIHNQHLIRFDTSNCNSPQNIYEARIRGWTFTRKSASKGDECDNKSTAGWYVGICCERIVATSKLSAS